MLRPGGIQVAAAINRFASLMDSVTRGFIDAPGWLAANFDERWADPARRNRLLDLVRSVEHEPDLIGVSPHLLAIGRKA